MTSAGEFVRIGQAVPQPRLARFEADAMRCVEDRVSCDTDAASLPEIEARIAGLLRLHRRALAEHHDLQRQVVDAPDATRRHHLRLEVAGVRDVVLGAVEEADRLRDLAGLLRARGAAW